jgi:glycosyltransferase involved in cell wall biosynthesis
MDEAPVQQVGRQGSDMRILHFMNVPLGIAEIRSGGKGINASGGWMAALLGKLWRDTDHAFACVAFGRTDSIQEEHGERLDCFVVPGNIIGTATDRTLAACREVVGRWRPDLIHIHGTEAVYGLLTARGLVDCPAVISLQGLIGPYAEWYRFFGNGGCKELIRMHRIPEILTGRGILAGFRSMQRMARREREIVTGNRNFLGRTAWDRAYVASLNPAAHYFHGGELLREPFWQERWRLDRARRHRIVFTNAGHPRKGTEMLLDAVRLLRGDYPGIQVAIAGGLSRNSGYGRYVRGKIAELGTAAFELGPLTAEAMAGELAGAHVFVSPSFIDNSPNALCEAQLLGMPVVATYTGGVPSLIEEGRTGLFVPTGDAPMLAARLREVFEDDALAERLGAQAHALAVERHDPEAIVHEILTAYETILGG